MKNSEQESLKIAACPFKCESDPVLQVDCDSVHVRCCACGSTGKTIYMDESEASEADIQRWERGDSDKENAEAIKAWNTRANENIYKVGKELTELEARLEKCLAFILDMTNCYRIDMTEQEFTVKFLEFENKARELLKELEDEQCLND